MRTILSFYFLQLKRRWVLLLVTTVLSFVSSSLVQLPAAAEHILYNRWQQSAQQVDVIIGFKGSPLQIVASSLYRMENPTGNLTEQTLSYWKKHPLVQESCAISLGDNFEGYPIVGVESNYFNWFGIDFVEGTQPATEAQIVLSSKVANEMGISIGDEIHSAHGSDSRGESHDHHHLTVVGIFRAQRPSDENSLFVTPSAYWGLHNSDNKSVTSILLKLKSKSALLMLPNVIAQRENEQGAFPVFIFGQLQKQWEPILVSIRSYSRLFSIVVYLLFIGYLGTIGRQEKPTIAYLKLIKASNLKVFAWAFGLILIFAVLGIVLSFIALPLVFDFPFQKFGMVLTCIPVMISTFLFYRIQNEPS
jgi:putative ABC transport system permease protein